MSRAGKIGIGVIVTLGLAAVSWVFLAGGAFWRSGEAFRCATEAKRTASMNRQSVAVLHQWADSHEREAKRRFDKIDASLEKLTDKIDGLK